MVFWYLPMCVGGGILSHPRGIDYVRPWMLDEQDHENHYRTMCYYRSVTEMLLSRGWSVNATALMCSGNKQPSFENVSIFLRISYRCKLKYDHIYPPSSPLQLSSYTLQQPTLITSISFLNDPLTLANVAHMCMGMGPSNGAWESYQWSHLPDRMTFPPLPLLTAKSFSVWGNPLF